MSGGATFAIVLVVLIVVIAIMCLIFCRCVKKETDDHFRRLKTTSIKNKEIEKKQASEKDAKLRRKITLKKNATDDFINIETTGGMRAIGGGTAKERSMG